MMMDGSWQSMGKSYLGVSMKIGAHTTQISITKVPMARFDAILGGPWLATEKPQIRWGINDMEWNGKVIAPAYERADDSRQWVGEFDPVEDALQRWGNAEWVSNDWEEEEEEEPCSSNSAIIQL